MGFIGDLKYYCSSVGDTLSSTASRLWGYVAVGNGSTASITFSDSGTSVWVDNVPASASDAARYTFPHGLKFASNLVLAITNVSNISVIYE